MNKKVKTIILIFIVILTLIAIYILIGILKNGNVRVIKTDDKEIVYKEGAIINGYKDGVSIFDGNISINETGKYSISGESNNSKIIVNADNVVLTLNNLNLTSKNGPVIQTNNENLIISIKDETTSTLTDTNNEREEDSVIYSTKNISFNGSGTLIINAKYKNAIKTLSNLQIDGGTYNATAIEYGYYAGKSILVNGGYLNTLESKTGISGETFAMNEGFVALNTEDLGINTTLGNITLNGGNIKINTGKTAINSNDSIIINGSSVEITDKTNNTNPIINYSKDYLIKKGDILTALNTNSIKEPTNNSELNTIKIDLGKEIESNTTLIIKDEKDTLIETELQNSTKTITFTSTNIINGKNYTISISNKEYETGEIKDNITLINEKNIKPKRITRRKTVSTDVN